MKLESLSSTRLSNLSVRIMSSMLEEADIDPTPILRAACLEPAHLVDPEGQVSAAQELRFQEGFVAATRSIPGIWLRTGLRYRLMSYGPLGLLVLSAPTVAAGLRVLNRYEALTFSLLAYPIEMEGDDPVALRVDDRNAPAPLREFLHERALGSVVMILNDMRQRPFPLERIDSVLDRPRNWLGCEQLVGAPIRFCAAETKWVFPRGIGREPLPMSNPLLEETYRRRCDQMIAEPQPADELVERFHALMVSSAKGFPTAKEVAEKLAISERTLHRRLSAQGLVFSSVLDRVREKRAREFLERSRMSIAQIAEMLDFAETASFSRAFKRWTGMSPLSFRKTMTMAFRAP
jgi:AraC-like DNA-binding protein